MVSYEYKIESSLGSMVSRLSCENKKRTKAESVSSKDAKTDPAKIRRVIGEKNSLLVMLAERTDAINLYGCRTIFYALYRSLINALRIRRDDNVTSIKK